MEKWKSWAIGIGAAWVLLAFVSWHVDSKCGVFFGKACFSEFLEWARWTILLKWVNPYQQLLAGLAALVGGAFVILAGREQIRHLRDTKKRERLDNALDGLYIVGIAVSEYFRAVSTSSFPPRAIEKIDDHVIRDISYISPQLSQYAYRFQVSTVELSERSSQNSGLFKRTKSSYIASSYCLFQAFSQIGKDASTNDNFQPRMRLSDYKFDCSEVEKLADNFSLNKSHFGRYAKFFPLERFNN
jgi:hypothetical protein